MNDCRGQALFDLTGTKLWLPSVFEVLVVLQEYSAAVLPSLLWSAPANVSTGCDALALMEDLIFVLWFPLVKAVVCVATDLPHSVWSVVCRVGAAAPSNLCCSPAVQDPRAWLNVENNWYSAGNFAG